MTSIPKPDRKFLSLSSPTRFCILLRTSKNTSAENERGMPRDTRAHDKARRLRIVLTQKPARLVKSYQNGEKDCARLYLPMKGIEKTPEAPHTLLLLLTVTRHAAGGTKGREPPFREIVFLSLSRGMRGRRRWGGHLHDSRGWRSCAVYYAFCFESAEEGHLSGAF